MQNPVEPNPHWGEYNMPQVEYAAQLDTTAGRDFAPPKTGYRTSSFWLLVIAGLGLAGLVIWGKLTSDQAIAIGNQIGVWSGLGISSGGLLSLVALAHQYLKGRSQVAAIRQADFGQIKKAEAQQNTLVQPMLLPRLDDSALKDQRIEYLEAQLRMAQDQFQRAIQQERRP